MTQNASADLNKKRRARSHALAQAVVDAFVERLKEEVDKHGGYLTQAHVQNLNTEFQTKADQLSAVFAQALEDSAREQEELHWHAIKRPAFDRLIVKRFEHLFVRRDADGTVHGNLSRRMLPGFFLALNMMLGPELLGKFQTRCDAAVDRVMKGKMPVDWDQVDHDPAVHDIILDAQYAITLHFEETARRYDWLIHIVNTHLAPVAEGSTNARAWELTPRVLHDLLDGLLVDIKKAVVDDVAWRHLAGRHKDADRHLIATILDRLQ